MFDYEEDLRQADAAVTSVLDRGLFVLEDRRRFVLRAYAASVKEMREHWALVGAYDPEEPGRRCFAGEMNVLASRRGAERGSGVPDLVYVEPAGMSRLVPSHRQPAGSLGCIRVKRTPEQEWHDFLAYASTLHRQAIPPRSIESPLPFVCRSVPRAGLHDLQAVRLHPVGEEPQPLQAVLHRTRAPRVALPRDD